MKRYVLIKPSACYSHSKCETCDVADILQRKAEHGLLISICCSNIASMGGGWFPKLVWPKHKMVNQQVIVGVANNDKRAKCWCGTDKVGVATATPAIRHSPPMIASDSVWVR